MEFNKAVPRKKTSGKIFLAVFAFLVVFIGMIAGIASASGKKNLAEMEVIANRLEAGPSWERLETQEPVDGSVCIAGFGGPCASYAYRWKTDKPYAEGDMEKYVRQVGLTPDPELSRECIRNERFNSGGLSCVSAGKIDDWDIRINVTDYPTEPYYTLQIVVLKENP